MIEIKPPEELTDEQLQALRNEWAPVTIVDDTKPSVSYAENTKLAQEFHELNKTLKEILREMRKRKT